MTDLEIWGIIIVLGFGTFLIRFSFLGLLGGRDLPPWLLRHLRYTAVGVMPALIAPLILWPQATGSSPDPARMGAAAVALAVGVTTKNVILSIFSGMATLYALIAVLG